MTTPRTDLIARLLDQGQKFTAVTEIAKLERELAAKPPAFFQCKVTACWPRHVNGPDTSKEAVLDIKYESEDGSGKFTGWQQISVPLPWNTDLKQVNLVGKTLTIIVQ